jgi:fatty acid desaturase
MGAVHMMTKPRSTRPLELVSMAAYAREVRPLLPKGAFAPAYSRALWLPVHYTIIAVLAWAMATGHVPWFLWPVASLVIGCCMGGVTFVGHESLHGGVVRGRALIRVVGWLGFLPFAVSPQLWVAWHNRVHHNHCGQPGVDTDVYPTLAEYKSKRSSQWIADHFALGRRRLAGVACLLFGFTGQSVQILFGARSSGLLRKNLHRRAIIETLMGVAVWTAVGFLVGPLVFVFAYVLPLIVANTIVMSFIMTNHNLSPLSPVNDPLVNSLSVTLPRALEWLTLDFGYHVEHHLFPTMSTRHGRVVREVLRTRYPGRYQSMPLTTALHQLHVTSRVYSDDVTLIDPRTGETWPTLTPRQDAPVAVVTSEPPTLSASVLPVSAIAS